MEKRPHPLYKTEWCHFHWRSHGCRHGDRCWYSHGIYDYRGSWDDLWVKWYQAKWREAEKRWQCSTDPYRNHDADHTADPIPPPGRTADPIPPFLPPEGADKEEGDADDGGGPAEGPGPKEEETNEMSADSGDPDDSSAVEAVAIGPVAPLAGKPEARAEQATFVLL